MAGNAVREQLVEAGIRLLEESGAEALRARGLAAEIGASTMAVYTHFGGMPGLLEAIRQEAFVRFAQRMREVPRTDDPVTDLFALGLAYREYAVANPQRYRLMFGVTAPGTGLPYDKDMTQPLPSGRSDIDTTFGQLVEVVERCIAAGRFDPADPVAVAGQIWSMTHGYVLLETARAFGDEGQGVPQIMAPLAVNLAVGLGDDRESVMASAAAAAQTAWQSR